MNETINHTHKAIPSITPDYTQLYENCECGAVRQVLDKEYKPVNKFDSLWHLCKICVMPSFESFVEEHNRQVEKKYT